METLSDTPLPPSRKFLTRLLAFLICLGFGFSGWAAMADQGKLVKSYEVENSVYQVCNQANDLISAGSPAKARDLLVQAAANDPTSYSSQVHLELAHCYDNLKDPQHAQSEAELALQFEPNNRQALYMLAVVCDDLHQYDRATKLLNQLLKSTDDKVFAAQVKKTISEITIYKNLEQAQTCMHDGRNADAQVFLERAASFDPSKNSAIIHSNLAYVLERTGNPEKAISEGDKALKFDSSDTHAMYTLGIAYQDIGKFDDAISWLKRYAMTETDSTLKEKANKFIQELADDRVKLDPADNSKPDYLDQLKENDAVSIWPQEKFPLKIYISNGKGVSGYRPIFRPFIVRSFNTWYEASGNKLRYQIVDDKKDADITVNWTHDPLSMSESGRTRQKAGLTWVNADSNKKIGNATVKIRTVNGFDPSKFISDGEAASVSMHEIGHSLGLGHSTSYSDIMYFGSSSKQKGFPTKRDRATIARLYKDYPVIAFAEQKATIPTDAHIEYLPPPAFVPPVPTNTNKMDPPFFVPPPAKSESEKLQPPVFVPPPIDPPARGSSKSKSDAQVAPPFFMPQPK